MGIRNSLFLGNTIFQLIHAAEACCAVFVSVRVNCTPSAGKKKFLRFCFARLHIHTHTSSSMPVMFLFINLCTIHIGGSQDCPGSGYLKMGSPQLIMNRKWKLI